MSQQISHDDVMSWRHFPYYWHLWGETTGLWSGIQSSGQWFDIDGLAQESRNSSALAMELCLSWTNPLICHNT